MLLYFLVIGIVVSGIFLYYSHYIAPRLNPAYKAEQYLKNGRMYDAIIEFKKALDRKPDDFVMHYKLANIYLAENEIDQAVSHLEKILFLNKYNYEVEKIEARNTKKRCRCILTFSITCRSIRMHCIMWHSPRWVRKSLKLHSDISKNLSK